MNENNYIIVFLDYVGFNLETCSKSEIDALLKWDEESENIGMEAENGCTNFTDDPDCINGNTCMIIKGDIVLPKNTDHIVKQTVTEYEL